MVRFVLGCMATLAIKKKKCVIAGPNVLFRSICCLQISRLTTVSSCYACSKQTGPTDLSIFWSKPSCLPISSSQLHRRPLLPPWRWSPGVLVSRKMRSRICCLLESKYTTSKLLTYSLFISLNWGNTYCCFMFWQQSSPSHRARGRWRATKWEYKDYKCLYSLWWFALM